MSSRYLNKAYGNSRHWSWKFELYFIVIVFTVQFEKMKILCKSGHLRAKLKTVITGIKETFHLYIEYGELISYIKNL